MILAVVIAGLAVPRLVAALDLQSGSAALALVEAGMRPGQAGLIRAIDAQSSALAVMPRAEPHQNAGYLALSLMEAFDLAPVDEAKLAEVARYHVRQALTLAPALPRGWLMLSSLDLRGADPAGAARALDLSFRVNPHLPSLAPLRWPLAMSLADRLDRETRERANLEFLSYFRAQPAVAVGIALRADRLAELRALASDRGVDSERMAAVLDWIRFERDAD